MLWNTNLFSKEKVCKREEEQEEDTPPFSRLNYIPLCIRPTPFDPFMHWWVFELSPFILSVVNSAAVTMECKYVVKILFSLIWGYMHRSRIAGLYDTYIFSFLRKLHLVFPQWLDHLYSHQQCISVPTASPSPAVSHPDDNHSNRYRWICFPWWLEMSLMCLLTILITPLEKLFCLL